MKFQSGDKGRKHLSQDLKEAREPIAGLFRAESLNDSQQIQPPIFIKEVYALSVTVFMLK